MLKNLKINERCTGRWGMWDNGVCGICYGFIGVLRDRMFENELHMDPIEFEVEQENIEKAQRRCPAKAIEVL